MAGPGGGGSRGGGFGGGSFGGGGRGGFSGGGGFGGGSFGGNFGGHHNGGSFGGHHHGHHHHHHGPWFGGPFFGRRRTYVGGGCGGAIFTVVVLVMFFIFGTLWLFAQPGQITINGVPVYIGEESFIYDEGTMQDYANSRYKEIFGEYEGYEDNILLVFLANEEADGYYTIAWVGDNIKYEINEMFGEYTEYGEYMNQYINTDYYGYTLDNNLADVVRAMEKSIVDANLGSSFKKDAADVPEKISRLVNFTEFEISKDVVNDAVTSFREATGIPLVIVVDMAEKVFGEGNEGVTALLGNSVTATDMDGEESEDISTLYFRGVFIIVGAVALIGVVAAIIIIAVKKNKKTNTKSKEAPKNDMPWES